MGSESPFNRETTGEHIRLLREDFRDLRTDLKEHAGEVEQKIEGVKAANSKMIYFVLAGIVGLLTAGATAIWSLRGSIDEKTPIVTHQAAVERLDRAKADKEQLIETRSSLEKIDTKLDGLFEKIDNKRGNR